MTDGVIMTVSTLHGRYQRLYTRKDRFVKASLQHLHGPGTNLTTPNGSCVITFERPLACCFDFLTWPLKSWMCAWFSLIQDLSGEGYKSEFSFLSGWVSSLIWNRCEKVKKSDPYCLSGWFLASNGIG